MASPQAELVAVGKSANGIPAGARWRGAVDPSEPIIFSIRLRPPDGVAAVSSDRPDNIGTSDGAEAEPQTQGDESAGDAVQEFARRTRLLVIEFNRTERRVVLWGSAADVGAALRTSFVHYEQHGRIRRGAAGPIYLPPRLAAVVEDISGLDDSLPDWVSSAIMSRGEQRVSPARLMTSRALLVGGALLIGVGLLLYWVHSFRHHSMAQDSKATQVAAQLPAAVPAAGTGDAPASEAPSSAAIVEEPAKFEAAAWNALNAGRLQEAQDGFLNALAADPGRTAAMHGLITVRRKMAEDNPIVMREQLAMYQKAIDRGTAADKYPLSSLKILVSAGLAAAQELEALPQPTASRPPVAAPAIIPPGPRQATVPARGDAQRSPAQSPSAPAKQPVPAAVPPAPPVQRPPAAAVPPKPVAPVVPAASAAQRGPTPGPAPAAPAPRAPSGVQPQAPLANRLYAVQITLFDRDRAAVLVKQLSAGGFPQAQMSAQPGYHVLSEPLPRKTAESLASTMAARGFHTDIEPLTGDTVQLLFGTFPSQKDAEALSGRIAGAGYDAWIREATVYTIRLGGPYSTSSVTAITGIVKINAPEAAVAADPVASAAAPANVIATAAGARPAPAGPLTQPQAPPVRAPVPPSGVQPQAPLANRLYAVQITLFDRDRGAALVRQLSAGGFPQAQMSAQPGYHVLSEPLPRKTAESLASTMAARGFHADIEPLTGDTVQLLFGTFPSQKDAEALSGRIAGAGYDAWIREATVYTIRLGGPYSTSSVTAITGIVKINAPEAAVAADPVP